MIKNQNQQAGVFSTWLQSMLKTQVSKQGVDVPCGECTACCCSSYFIHIGPDEIKTLSVIPKKLQFPAPLLPPGNVVLGFDKDGRCPMLIEKKCSIYENRPRTCRNYDCRIFTATGISPGDKSKILIDHQVQRWEFSYPSIVDREQHSAVQATARFVQEHVKSLPTEMVPNNPTQLAMLVLKVYTDFLNKSGMKKSSESTDDHFLKKVVKAFNQFEARNK